MKKRKKKIKDLNRQLKKLQLELGYLKAHIETIPSHIQIKISIAERLLQEGLIPSEQAYVDILNYGFIIDRDKKGHKE